MSVKQRLSNREKQVIETSLHTKKKSDIKYTRYYRENSNTERLDISLMKEVKMEGLFM